jgi:hypothetical protein
MLRNEKYPKKKSSFIEVGNNNIRIVLSRTDARIFKTKKAINS